jgi:hypothetical protein
MISRDYYKQLKQTLTHGVVTIGPPMTRKMPMANPLCRKEQMAMQKPARWTATVIASCLFEHCAAITSASEETDHNT